MLDWGGPAKEWVRGVRLVGAIGKARWPKAPRWGKLRIVARLLRVNARTSCPRLD